jgi:hypothetical protein
MTDPDPVTDLNNAVTDLALGWSNDNWADLIRSVIGAMDLVERLAADLKRNRTTVRGDVFSSHPDAKRRGLADDYRAAVEHARDVVAAAYILREEAEWKARQDDGGGREEFQPTVRQSVMDTDSKEYQKIRREEQEGAAWLEQLYMNMTTIGRGGGNGGRR